MHAAGEANIVLVARGGQTGLFSRYAGIEFSHRVKQKGRIFTVSSQ
jgi:hypothetical protein